MLGVFPLPFVGGRLAAGRGHVDNVNCPSWARPYICGQVGQPKNKLSTMSTNTKGFWEKEKGAGGKATQLWTSWTMWTTCFKSLAYNIRPGDYINM